MKKRNLSIILIILLITSYSYSQNKLILNINETDLSGINVIPDVAGNVLIEEDYYKNHLAEKEKETKPNNTSRSITVYDGWPNTGSKGSSNGSIFVNMDEDPELEILFMAGELIEAWNIDGSSISGWPVNVVINNCYPSSAPSMGDVDGDGEDEIIVGTSMAGTGIYGYLFVFEKDGTSLAGFPMALPDGGASGFQSPVPADLDADGTMEIIVAERASPYPAGYVTVINGDGTVRDGWPFDMGHVPASSCAVGDINADGIPEIIAESYEKVFALDINGNLLPGFPYELGHGVLSYSAPTIADITGDGHREIVFGSHDMDDGTGAVHIVKSDGSLLSGWPQTTAHWIYAPPVVVDVNNDENLDIVCGDKLLSEYPVSKLYAWDKSGQLLSGWPSTSVHGIFSQATCADFDGDGEVELIIDNNSSTATYTGINADGSLMDGDWPLVFSDPYTETTMMKKLTIADVNADNLMDLSGGCHNEDHYTKFYLWNTDKDWNESLVTAGVYQYNNYHNGVLPQNVVLLLPPSNLLADLIDNDVQLSWDAPSTRDLLGYRVFKDEVEITSDIITETEYSDSDITPGLYQYSVKAIYNEGISPASNIEVVTYNVVAPSNFNGVLVDNDVTLTWDAPASRALLGYRLYKDGEDLSGLIQPGTLEYIDENISLGTYEYYIIAEFDGANSESSNIVSIEYVLMAPQDLWSTTFENDVTLNWDPIIASGFIGYRVYRNDEDISGLITNNEYSDLDLPNDTYIYYVIAEYNLGFSGNSNVIEILIDYDLVSEEVLQNSVDVYPVPANEVINLSSDIKIEEVTISNSIGQILHQEEINAHQWKYSTIKLNNGIYIIRIITEKGQLSKTVVIN